jgi:hypothetical protein
MKKIILLLCVSYFVAFISKAQAVNKNLHQAASKTKKNKEVKALMTGEAIIKKYIAAIGGTSAIAAIKDADITGITNVMGKDMYLQQRYILPNYFMQSITNNGKIYFKQITNNGEYQMIIQGTKQPVDDATKEELNEEAVLINENYFISNHYTLVYKGKENINENETYILGIKSPTGKFQTNYYDVTTGLKVKASQVEESPTGNITVNTFFKDYKEFNGIKIPTVISIDQGPIKGYKLTDVKINTGLKIENIN